MMMTVCCLVFPMFTKRVVGCMECDEGLLLLVPRVVASAMDR